MEYLQVATGAVGVWFPGAVGNGENNIGEALMLGFVVDPEALKTST